MKEIFFGYCLVICPYRAKIHGFKSFRLQMKLGHLDFFLQLEALIIHEAYMSWAVYPQHHKSVL